MWLVLAHDWDVTAAELTRTWSSATRLVSPADVRGEGWTLRMSARGASVGCPAGPFAPPERVAAGVAGVAGVLTRLGVVTVGDVPAVHSEDRRYAAAELGAFLLAWLDACPAPVVNRPRPGCLNGPPWSPQLWAAAAAAAGMRVGRRRESNGLAGTSSGTVRRLTVIGRQLVGDADARLASAVLRLAELAGTVLLGVDVDEESSFVAATARPELDSMAQSVLAEALGWTTC
jgi:hypothetical protein